MKLLAEEIKTARLILLLKAVQQHVQETEEQEKLYKKIKTITELTGNEAVKLSYLQ